jgi:type I restriction enzyme S subunit
MKKTPKLRFPKFSGAWEEKKLESFLIESKIKGSNGKIANKLSVKLWGKGVVPKKEIYDGSSETQYYIRKKGQLMYGKLDFLNCAFGIVPEYLDGYESTLDAPAFDVSDINSYFLLNKITQKNFYEKYGNIANGSRKAKRIHAETFLDMNIDVPSMEEQEKIAIFLLLIDEKIEKHQKKVDALEEYKKGMIQKIFSREIRFKNKNGEAYQEWEEKKLNDYIIEYTEKTTENNQYPVLTSSRNGIVLQTEYFKDRQITTEDNIGYHVLPFGYVTFRSRSDDGNFTFNQNKIIYRGIVSYFYPVFTFNDKIDDYYALIYMNNYLGKQILKEIVGTSQLVLSINKLKNLIIEVPYKEEQEKIASFFSVIDKKLEKEQQKLEALSQWKKGLLQQMFV